MSKMREQLEAMKREYRSAKYPGDLASELLALRERRTRPSMRIVGWSAAITGIAAAIVIWISVFPSKRSTPEISVASNQTTPTPWQSDATPPIEQEVIEVDSFAEMGAPPAFPSEMTFTPTESSLEFPSTFTFPSMELDFSQSTETTEESA